MGRIGYLDTSQVAGAMGLGSASMANTGTSGTVVPLLSTANTWSAAQVFGPVTCTTLGATGINCSSLASTGPVSFFPAASVSPTSNGQLVFELTSDTTLTIKAKGSDGTVRSVALTLA